MAKFKKGDRVRLIMDPDLVYSVIAVHGTDYCSYDLVAETDNTLKIINAPEDNLSLV